MLNILIIIFRQIFLKKFSNLSENKTALHYEYILKYLTEIKQEILAKFLSCPMDMHE